LRALDAHFAEGHVPLGIVLGTIGALSVVTDVLPDAARSPLLDDGNAAGVRASDANVPGVRASDANVPAPVDPFLALLLGAVATHHRLITLVDRAGAAVTGAPHDAEVVATDPLEGIAR
jgi:hypothetical protein